MRLGLVSVVLLVWLTPSISTSAERVSRVAKVQDWSVFRHIVNSEPLCWVSTTPMATSPDLSKRSVFVLYTLGNYQLSVNSRTAKFPSSSGRLKVGGTNFPMFFRGHLGWMRGYDDSLVIEAFLLNQTAGMNSGNSGFAFSLKGFEEAAKRAAQACNVPPFAWSERPAD